jgi:hypothetical protein
VITKDTAILYVNDESKIINRTVTKLTNIKDITPNTQASLEGAILKISTLGAAVGTLCTIADESGAQHTAFLPTFRE